MESMRDIRHRISSVRDIQHITRAMKMVSVAKLHRMENTAAKARVYRDTMDEIFNYVFKKIPGFKHPYFTEKKGGATLLIALASDKGLCGAYNANIVKRTVNLVTEAGAGAMKLIVVGKRAIRLLKLSGISIDKEFTGFTSRPDPLFAEIIARQAVGIYDSGEVSRVEIIFNSYKRKGVRGVHGETILPVLKPEADERPARENYLYEPRLDMVIDRLLRKYLENRIYSVLIETQLSEHLARMQAMESASDNAKELIDELTLSYNKARQSSITNEILDIVGGAELLR